MVDDISIVSPRKYIEPKRSMSVNSTQHITQNDASKFLSNTSVTIPTASISKLKFLINSSPIICKAESVTYNINRLIHLIKFWKNGFYLVWRPWYVIQRINRDVIVSLSKIHRFHGVPDRLHSSYLIRRRAYGNVLHWNLRCLKASFMRKRFAFISYKMHRSLWRTVIL